MIEFLLEADKSLFFFLHNLRADWLDPIMFWVSNKYIWFPFYGILLAWIIKEYKKKSIIFIIGLILAVAVADQITSGFMKPFFERFRPSRDSEIGHLVHTINDYRGGRYGFASSHAANAFALAIFTYLLFKKNHQWIVWIFLWAAVVAYSRIYLGVHYPGDILVGAVIGSIAGWAFYSVATKLMTKYFSEAQEVS